jgi:hypothetical protein
MANTENLIEGLDRSKRENKTREVAMRPRKWKKVALLPEPKPEPGYTFRWVRLALNGQDDPKNISVRLEEGYEPVKASMHPEITMLNGKDNHFPDSIQIGGLLLTKIPTEMVEDRAAMIEEETANQLASADSSFMRESNSKMPLFNDRRSSSSFGKGF